MKYTPALSEVVAEDGEHVVMTGDHIKGSVTLTDGESVDVTAPFVIARDADHAAEIAHAIGLHWADPANVHPAQVNVDEDGAVTVNDFDYDDSHHQAATSAKKKG